MLGFHINNENHSSSYASISLGLFLLTIFLGIFIGPFGVFGSSSLGLIIAIWSFISAKKNQGISRPIGYPTVVMVLHSLLLIVGVVLQILFLNPLSKDVQKLPRLQTIYSDPGGIFHVRGPANWEYEALPSRFETGVRIRPVEQSQYMGVSEITVLIRKLENKPKSTEKFLQEMASTWVAKKKSESDVFEFEIMSAEFLDKKQAGVWAILDAKRFWVPLRQVSLLGIKKRLYLCSVSAIGLKNHSNLSKILCLGLFESIQIETKEK